MGYENQNNTAVGLVGGGQYAQTAQAQKVPQVEQELSRMDGDIGRMEAYIERLSTILISVVRAEPPATPAGALKEIAEALVPRAEQIRHLRNRITHAANALDSILGRLEV